MTNDEKRSELLRLEAEIKRMDASSSRNPNEEDPVTALLYERKQLLDSLFLGTKAECCRFREINDRCRRYRCLSLRRIQRLRRDLAHTEFMALGRCALEGRIVYSYYGPHSVLWLEDDAAYGSDFTEIIGIFYRRIHSEVYYGRGFLTHPDHHLTLAEYDIELCPDLFDSLSWTIGPNELQEYAAALREQSIDMAIHRLWHDTPLSLPDILRLEPIRLIERVVFYYPAKIDSSRLTFGIFRRAMLQEAKHRPKEWSLGEFLYRRSRACLNMEDIDTVTDPRLDEAQAETFLKEIYDKKMELAWECALKFEKWVKQCARKYVIKEH